MQECQKRVEAMMTGALPAAQKNAEECLRLMDQNTRSSMDLLKKVFETCQSESIAEAQTKIRDLWEASLGTLRQNAQAIVQTNARAMEAWASCAKRNSEGKAMAAAH